MTQISNYRLEIVDNYVRYYYETKTSGIWNQTDSELS